MSRSAAPPSPIEESVVSLEPGAQADVKQAGMPNRSDTSAPAFTPQQRVAIVEALARIVVKELRDRAAREQPCGRGHAA